MLDTLRFWLDRGVDGFRMDVIHLIGKGDDLPEPTADEAKVVTGIIDVPQTHEHLREIRACSTVPRRSTSVGEVFLLDPAQVATYYGDDDEPAPVVQLRSPVQPMAAPGGPGPQRPHGVRGAGRRRALGHVGAVQPRQTATAPATAATSASLERPPCFCSPCAAHRSSTPAKSSASRTPSCHPSATSTRPAAGAMAAGPRSRGLRSRATGGPPARHVAPLPAGARSPERGSLVARPDSILHLTATPRPARGRPPAPARLDRGARVAGGGPRLRAPARRRCPTVAISFSPDATPVAVAGHVEVSSDPRRAAGAALVGPLRPVRGGHPRHHPTRGAGHGQCDPHRGRRGGAPPVLCRPDEFNTITVVCATSTRGRPRRRRRRQRRAGGARARRGQGLLRRVRARLVHGVAGRARTAPAGGCGTPSPTSG